MNFIQSILSISSFCLYYSLKMSGGWICEIFDDLGVLKLEFQPKSKQTSLILPRTIASVLKHLSWANPKYFRWDWVLDYIEANPALPKVLSLHLSHEILCPWDSAWGLNQTSRALRNYTVPKKSTINTAFFPKKFFLYRSYSILHQKKKFTVPKR